MDRLITSTPPGTHCVRSGGRSTIAGTSLDVSISAIPFTLGTPGSFVALGSTFCLPTPAYLITPQMSTFCPGSTYVNMSDCNSVRIQYRPLPLVWFVWIKTE
jgi:hypothetical protein